VINSCMWERTVFLFSSLETEAVKPTMPGMQIPRVAEQIRMACHHRKQSKRNAPALWDRFQEPTSVIARVQINMIPRRKYGAVLAVSTVCEHERTMTGAHASEKLLACQGSWQTEPPSRRCASSLHHTTSIPLPTAAVNSDHRINPFRKARFLSSPGQCTKERAKRIRGIPLGHAASEADAPLFGERARKQGKMLKTEGCHAKFGEGIAEWAA
jgi:hypothetical protein